ncbi:MAG: hypothetical protein B7X10_02185, partial [Burkholderiales bacterium 21-58-4]
AEIPADGSVAPSTATPETTPPNTGTEATPESAEPPKEPREPWFQKRINELTAKYRDEERKRQALEAILQAPEGTKTETPPPDLDQLVNARAAQIAAQQALNEAAERTYQAGKGKHADFDAAVQGLSQVADLSQAPHFLEAITKLPNGADVYYHLGKHLDDAAHVLSLSPVNMALELARLSASVAKPASVSKAPPPITPVSGSAGGGSELSDDLPIGEWIKRREAQLKSR